MKLKSLIRKSLAKVPPEFAGQQRRFAESVSENLDVLSGRRGNLIDRAVTFRDLLDAGVLRRASGLVTDSGTIDLVPAGDPNDPDNGVVDAPTQPTGLTATGGFGRIHLSWNLPRYRGHSRIQVFRHTSDNLSAAQAAGVYYEYFGDAHFFYDIGLPSNTTYYYWVRSVNKLGAISAFNSSTGTSATTAIDYLYVSGLIDDILDDDVNSLGLNTAITNAGTDVTQIEQDISDIESDITDIQSDISDLNSINAWSSSVTYAENDMVTHGGKIWKASQASTNQTPATGSSYWTEIGNYSNLVDFVSATQDQNVSTISELNTNYYTISGVNGAISAATTNLASQSYVQTELGDYTTTASLQQNYYTKTGADSAVAAATTNLASQSYVQTELGDYTTTASLTQNYYTKTGADSAIASATSGLASQTYVQTELGDYTNTANLNLNYYTKTGANSAIASATLGLASTTYVTNALGSYTTTADLNTYYYTKTGADSAISSGITNFTTTVGSETLTLQQHHSSINGIEGKYSIKIDDNGSVAGFGLISTANDGVPSTGTGSAFIVAADRFAITSDFDSEATENGTVGDNYPFKVFTTPHNVTDADGNQSYNDDGTAKTIPAGVYIDNAFIHDAQITGAMIEEATITDANIGSLDAGKIRSGQIQIDNQNNFAIFQGKTQVVGQDADGNDIIEGDYSSLASGFFLGNVNGYGAFHIGAGSSRYLKFNSSNGDLIATGLEILAADGTKLVKAGGLIASSGANMVFNPNFRTPEYVMNALGTALVESTTAVLGWKLTSGTISVDMANGHADLSTDAYMDSTGQRFHASEGEKIYLYAEHNQSSGAGVSVQVLGFSTPDPDASPNGFIQGSFNSVYVGAGASSGRDMGTKETDASGRYLSVGCVTILETGYYSVRLKANGSGVRYYVAGASITPPVIDPVYAPTYIRDLSVDTLQIAGNAVTVADSASTFPTGTGTNKVTLEKETTLLPQGSAIIWLINAIVNETSGNPDSYDLVVNIYTRGANQTSYPSSPTYTKPIWIYSKSLDARMMEFALPATSAFTNGGYMKCSVRLQTHVNYQANYTSGTLVNGGGIEIVYLGAKK